VRAALAADRPADGHLGEPSARRVESPPQVRSRGATWAWAAGAAALLAVAVGIFTNAPRRAEATPREALWAADLVRNARSGEGGVGTCGAQDATSPFRFPLVERRELGVRGCVGPDEGAGASAGTEQALLYRLADRDLVGYVAVPDARAPRGPEIGVTRLSDVIVFDVHLGGAAYYLAVKREKVDREGNCAACHGSSKKGEQNPHRFKERRFTVFGAGDR
jgi:hypothetical protein